MTWSFFAPAEDWAHPREVDETELGLIQYIGQQLNLRFTRDDVHRKVFLGLPQAKPAQPDPPSYPKPHPASNDPADGFLYPSGRRFRKAQLSEAEAARYGTTGLYQAAPLLEIRPEDQVSEHFRASEFFPHDASYRHLRVSAELLRRLERLRAVAGALNVHSAFRPPAYNREIGGVAGSAHIDGLAADISSSELPVATLHALAEPIFADGGLGYYPSQGFIHVDVRGSRARWTGV